MDVLEKVIKILILKYCMKKIIHKGKIITIKIRFIMDMD